MYTSYLWRTVVQVLFTLIAYPMALIVVPFTQSNGYLPNCFAWFQTFDASLDTGWNDANPVFMRSNGMHYVNPTGLLLYWLRVRWLWRNPAYGFCYWPLGIPYDSTEWNIILHVVNPDGTLAEFEAHTYDGKYFCYTNDKNVKLGYKLWWALDAENQLLPRLGPDRGPDNRLPICFTPF